MVKHEKANSRLQRENGNAADSEFDMSELHNHTSELHPTTSS